MIRSFTCATTSSTTVPFGVIAGVTGSVICCCGAFGTPNGLWYRGACAKATPGSASQLSPHTTANCEILKVIVTRILVVSQSISAMELPPPGISALTNFRPDYLTHPGVGRYPYPILTALATTSESPFRSGTRLTQNVILRPR